MKNKKTEISLLVKGNLTNAISALVARSTEFDTLTVDYRGESFTRIVLQYGTIIDTVSFRQIMVNWYHEDPTIVPGYGYPDGTLLWFQDDRMKK